MGADGVKKMLDSAGVGKASGAVAKASRKGKKAKDQKEKPAEAYLFHPTKVGVPF